MALMLSLYAPGVVRLPIAKSERNAVGPAVARHKGGVSAGVRDLGALGFTDLCLRGVKVRVLQIEKVDGDSHACMAPQITMLALYFWPNFLARSWSSAAIGTDDTATRKI